MSSPTPKLSFAIVSKRPLLYCFGVIWLLLLLLLPALWLPTSLLIGLGLLSFAWLYYCYLRAFEARLMFEPVTKTESVDAAGPNGQWLLEDLSGVIWRLKLDYIGSQLLIFTCLDGGRQCVFIRPMFDAEDWRQLQLTLRWPL